MAYPDGMGRYGCRVYHVRSEGVTMPVLGVILLIYSMGSWDSWNETDAVAITARFKTVRECETATAKTVKRLRESGRQIEVVSAFCYGPKDVEA